MPTQNQVRADFEKWVTSRFFVRDYAFNLDTYGRYISQVWELGSNNVPCELHYLWLSYLAGRASK